MKRTLAVLIALFSFSALASDHSLKCEQRLDRSPVKPAVGKISVVITHIKNIAEATDYRGEYRDSIDQVKVVITSTKNGQTTVVKKAKTIATSEDVMYMIHDDGILFHHYMDEVDEASIKFAMNGKKVAVSLVCE